MAAKRKKIFDYVKTDCQQRKTIKMPDISGMTVDRASDETGSFAKSEMDKLKVYNALSRMRPFSQRSQEEIMEFICYMFEQKASANDTVCHPADGNHNFYFVASGKLLHRKTVSGGHQSQMHERRLTELDFWGLECLCTGQVERISVTASSACRLFVLTSRRFYWLCQMSARRTHRLQLETIGRLTSQLNSVRLALGLNEEPLFSKQVTEEHAQLHVLQGQVMLPHEPEDLDPRQQQQQQQHQQQQQQQRLPVELELRSRKSNIKRLMKVANQNLLNGLLHSIRQLELSTHHQDKSDQSVLISCTGDQSVILYCQAGAVNLVLDHCSDIINSVMEQNATLYAGQTFEIRANENWKLTNGSEAQNQCRQKTIVCLIRLRITAQSTNGSTN